MSRSIMDEPGEQKPEPSSNDIMQLLWGLAAYMTEIERKLDIIAEELGIAPEEPEQPNPTV